MFFADIRLPIKFELNVNLVRTFVQELEDDLDLMQTETDHQFDVRVQTLASEMENHIHDKLANNKETSLFQAFQHCYRTPSQHA